MKKTLSLILVFMLLFCTVMLVSCAKPASDPDDAEEALKENGYNVNRFKEDGNTYILASKGLDNIKIVYYKDEDDAEDAYDELEDKYEDFEEFADEYDIDIDDIDYGKSGNMVWDGTKDAVKDAR